MNKYKASIYNVISDALDGDVLIQNSLYDTYVKIEAGYRERLLELCDGGEYEIDELPLGEELVKANIFVKSDRDEKKLADYYCNSIVYSNDVLHISIIPTDACNFRCKYCYESIQTHYMDENVVCSIKKFLSKAAKKYKGMFISWYGGEPTLAIDSVINIMEHAKKVCRANGIPLYGQMTTNGYLLSKDIFSELLNNHVLSYMVTIDGTKETHNDQRPHRTNLDSYSRILLNLRHIRDSIHRSNFRIGIRINITPQILPYLKDYVEWASSEFGNDTRFGIIWEWVKDWGGEQICHNYGLVMDSYESTEYEQYLEYITHSGVQIDRGQAHTSLGSEMCIASRKNGFTINYDGLVYKCAMAIYEDSLKEYNCIGELNADGDMIIDELKNAIWVGQGELSKECNICKHYPECMGLLCPLATKIRKIFVCPHILEKESGYLARNMEALGKFTTITK